MDINLNQMILFILVGFGAQLIDGSLGMAYGVSANAFLLGTGVPPAAASASVHLAEVFTTGFSGFSHLRFGNIRKDLFIRLILPGVLGGILGAYLLSNIPGNIIKPFVSLYLLIMGIRILVKAVGRKAVVKERPLPRYLSWLGLVGGFFDAVGGGGWGPIVTTTLLARGNNPRETIGSVNASEFFVTFAEAVTFIATIGITNPSVILGLVIGGCLAAPFGAYITRRVPARAVMGIVGVLISFLSMRTILLAI